MSNPPSKRAKSWQPLLAISVLVGLGAAAMLMAPPTSSRRQTNTQGVNAQPENTFAIRNVRVFDGEETIESTSVLVQEGKISALGQEIKIPADTLIYDGSGKTLLPGLIDAHTHSFGEARKDALRFGVTTELDMFSDWHALGEARKQRESWARTELADLWSAGTLATVPGGHGTEYGMKIPTLTTAAEAPVFVKARIDEGSDYLKIVVDDGSAYGPTIKMNSLSPEVTGALISQAHSQSLQAVVHIATLKQATQVAEQGADGLAHIFIDQVADQNFIEAAKQNGLFVIPTLSVTSSLAGAKSGKALAADPQLNAYLTLAQSGTLKASFPAQWQNPVFLQNAIESVRLLHAAGIAILAGTDAGNPSTAHGVSLHGELALLVQAGLTPRAALHAATALPAKIFGLQDRGRISEGLRADLILVEGDPTQDITATRIIANIWKNGYRVERPKAGTADTRKVPLPPETMISDFEQDQIASRYGEGWSVTTDQRMNGQSTATIKLLAGGAQSSRAALLISGKINPGFSFPWAGTFFSAGTKDQPALDYSNASQLRFKVKGDGRSYQVMAFSSVQAGIPPSQRFTAGPQWQEVRFPLDGFAGLELSQVSGFSFNASEPEGEFEFLIDDVEIR